jgi:hypothetical protein
VQNLLRRQLSDFNQNLPEPAYSDGKSATRERRFTNYFTRLYNSRMVGNPYLGINSGLAVIHQPAVNASMQHVGRASSYCRACNVVLKRYGPWKSVWSPAFLSGSG